MRHDFYMIWSWKFKDNNKSWPKLCFQLFALIPCRLVDIITYSTVDRNNRISMYAKENWKRTVEFLCFRTYIAFMRIYRVSHSDMVESKRLWGVERVKILMIYLWLHGHEGCPFVFHQPVFNKVASAVFKPLGILWIQFKTSEDRVKHETICKY